jgi:hypothetical protein
VRDEQYARLKALSEKLADTVIGEADPDNWTGNGKKPAELTREERGDRYWCKKNCAATLSVLMRIYSVAGMVERAGRPPAELPAGAAGETDLDREVSAAEREAQAILKRIAKTSRARSN